MISTVTHTNHTARIHMSHTHKFESCGEDRVVVAARVVERGDDEGGGHEGVDGVGKLRLVVGEKLGCEAAQHRRHALDGESEQDGDLFVGAESNNVIISYTFGSNHV